MELRTLNPCCWTDPSWRSWAGLLSVSLLLAACEMGELVEEAAVAEFDRPAPPSFTRGLITRYEPSLLYPLRARNQLVQGWVMLQFDVDEAGLVIPASLEIEEEQPPGYFAQSALNAARRLRFENTRGAIVEDIHYVFRFELEEQSSVLRSAARPEPRFRELIPGRYITPDYPAAALREGVEGYVIVTFTVTEEGVVEDVAVRESSAPGVFDGEAQRAATRLRFEPRLIDGEPVAVEDVEYRFDWSLPR